MTKKHPTGITPPVRKRSAKPIAEEDGYILIEPWKKGKSLKLIQEFLALAERKWGDDFQVSLEIAYPKVWDGRE